LTLSATTGSAPLALTADASASSPGSAPIQSYAFDFGDGTTSGPLSASSAGHTYSAPGNYSVTVTVTDSDGTTSTATSSVTVTPPATGSPASYVNQIATNYSTSSHTSGYVAVWRTQGVTAGNLIVVTVQLTGTTPTGAVSGTDAAGDTLTVAASQADSSGNRLIILSGRASTGLAVGARITVSFPTAASYRILADEVAGASTADQAATNAGPAGPYSSGSAGVVVLPGELAFGAVATFGGVPQTWGSGWSTLTSYPTGSNGLGRAYQTPTGTPMITASGNCTGSWIAAIVTFH
jgi:PKD repeat protein